jgi:hypothetical protein
MSFDAVAGNAGGSYMTIMSSGGLQFGILEIISSFGNVWADQSYWQASPVILTKLKAYFRR